MIKISKENLISFGGSEITIHENYICVKATEKNGVCTPYFQSLSEKVKLKISGKIEPKSVIGYTIYSYDENGTENVVHSENIQAAQENTFDTKYSFDPISLGVYQNAVKFRVVLYAVSEFAEVYITDFSLEERCDEEEYVDEPLTACTIQTEEKIKVPIIPQKVLFIGNSILLGMFNTYGMCATSPQKDYAYLVQQKILKHNAECTFSKLHGSGFEHAESLEAFEAWFAHDANIYTGKPARESFSEDLDLIFIQLTDNVNTEEKKANFEKLADIFIECIKELSPRARIIWVHGWYNKKNTYNKFLELCERWSIERVDVSDLRKKENESYSGQISWHPENGEVTVKDTWITHPGDKGMQEIAKRMLAAIGL